MKVKTNIFNAKKPIFEDFKLNQDIVPPATGMVDQVITLGILFFYFQFFDFILLLPLKRC